MKKTLSIILCLVMILSSLPIIGIDSFAEDISIEWDITLDGKVSPKNKDQIKGKIIVPDIVDGRTVVEIADNAFSGCSFLNNIVLPRNIKSIGCSAFWCCTSLTNISIPYCLDEIKSDVFYGCENLKYILIPEGIRKIGESAFAECHNLESIELPNSLKIIEKNAFYNCKSLKALYMYNNVLEIGEEAFSNCEMLQTVQLSNNIKTISDGLFYNCYSLNNISIPSTVTSIGMYAFFNCRKLSEVEIPEDVNIIGKYAFSGCESLTNIDIPNNVVEIYDNTFYNCKKLNSINIPNYLYKIGKYAFYGCESLENIKLPDKVSVISEYAFFNCKSLKNFIFPNSIKAINDFAFYGTNSLSNIVIPDSVCTIGNCSFGNNNNAIIRVGKSVVKIGNAGNFSGQYRVDSLNEKFLSIDGSLFSKDGTKLYYLFSKNDEFIIPDGVAEIGKNVLGGLIASSVTIPRSVEKIDSQAFDISNTQIICGYKNSYAETYAIKYGYNFIDLENMPTDDPNIPDTPDTPVNPPKTTFPDVKSTDWFSDSVDYAVEKGYFKGYADGTFGPGKNIIRQDFAVVMAKAAGADLEHQSTANLKFKDIDKNSYYAKALAWCVEKGIISGYANGNFGPADNITREQICVMVYNYMTKVKGVKDTLTASQRSSILSKYPDKNRISDWAKNAVAWSINNKVISGANGGKEVQSYAFANRAQIATIFTNMSKNGLI